MRNAPESGDLAILGRSFFWRIGAVAGFLLILLPWSRPALATVAACYRLANVISPADFKIAYNFVTHHG